DRELHLWIELLMERNRDEAVDAVQGDASAAIGVSDNDRLLAELKRGVVGSHEISVERIHVRRFRRNVRRARYDRPNQRIAKRPKCDQTVDLVDGSPVRAEGGRKPLHGKSAADET